MSGRPDFDLYEELQVSRNATTEVIEAAHRSLAKKHHPDVAGADPAALERTKRINIARDWLTDPQLRASYDRGLPPRATSRPRRPASPPTPGTRPPWASSRPAPSDASVGSTLAELRQLALRPVGRVDK